MFEWEELKRNPASRRTFLAGMTAAGLGVAAARLFSGEMASAASSSAAALAGGPTDGAAQFAAIPGANIDFKVLNFALTLEILEADLYRQALNVASGLPISKPLSGNPGTYSLKVGNGGLSASSGQQLFGYLLSFSYVEAAHRDFLRATIEALGGTPVQPNPRGYKFHHQLAENINDIMSSILPLEETGVRAYLGALPYLTNLGYAQLAGTIYSTEARHSGVIAQELGLDAGPHRMPGDLSVVPKPPADNTFEYYLNPSTVIARAKTYFA